MTDVVLLKIRSLIVSRVRFSKVPLHFVVAVVV